MKTSLLFFMFFASTSFLFSQTFEHKYTGDNGQIYQVAENEFVYGIENNSLKQFNIYSLDHSLIKTINLIPDTLNYFDEFHLSRTLFNADEKYELLYTCFYPDVEFVKVLNEDGTLLLDQQDVHEFCFYNTNQGTKLLLSSYNHPDPGNIDVYGLPGKYYNSVKLNQNPESFLFPNPVSDNLTITYESMRNEKELILSIYSSNGQFIRQIQLNPQQKTIQVNVSALSSGLYFYTINNGNITTKPVKFIVSN